MDGTDAAVEDGTTDGRFGAVWWRVTPRSVAVGGEALPAEWCCFTLSPRGGPSRLADPAPTPPERRHADNRSG